MLGGRTGFEHRERNAGAFEPFLACGLWYSTAAIQRGLDEIEALIETVAAKGDVGGLFPYRLNPVVRSNHVLAPDLEGAHPDELRKIVHCAFDGESGL